MYVVAPNIQYFFVDRDTGEPLSQGKVFFYRDVDMVTPKAIYELQGNAANYTYSPLPNPLILSSVGTIVDDNGNQVIPYFKPFDAEGNQDLYYIVVQNAVGAPQFVVHAWPNPQGGTGPSGENGLINYIPNGQFLAHTNLPDNELLPGSNIIAQGGWTIELDAGATSTNTLTYLFEQPTAQPPQSPRWVANFICTVPVLSEINKSFRIKWNDVNKFNDQDSFTYAFWAQATNVVNVTIAVVKYFGSGTSSGLQPPIPVDVGTITTSAPIDGLYNFNVDFGSNEGFTVGPNNDDWVAIDIIFSTSDTFNVQLCDFVLIAGVNDFLSIFPLQTNANMLAEGVAGWMDTPNPDGSDLYLPLVLTKLGMTFDRGGIGKIYADSGVVLSPNNALAYTNDMPMDGTEYISGNYSKLGIPYSRLGNALMAKSTISSYPLWGTGPNYATAWTDYADDTQLYLINNSAGTPVAGAADGGSPTGFTFTHVVSYAGVTAGRVTTQLQGSWGGTADFQALAQVTGPTITGASTTGLPGFSFAIQNTQTGLYANQNFDALVGVATAASTFTLSGGVSAHIDFTYSAIGTVRLYYKVAGQSGSEPSFSANDMVLNVVNGTTALQIAELTAAALSGFQISQIAATGIPSNGEYFTFQTNAGTLRTFTVLYSTNSSATNPNPSDEFILVNTTGITTHQDLASATYTAINSYQYFIPNLAGMFPRGYDPNAIWDLDVDTRIGFGILGGPYYGTYEYQQLKEHIHTFSNQPQASGSTFQGGSGYTAIQGNTTPTGGTETRPVNFVVNWVIKY